jgi:inward rectifier potassium channel
MASAQSPRQIERRGLEPRGMRDLYHQLLTISWPRLLLLVIAAYFAVNLLFALLYLAVGGGIENARPGNFMDLFFFSFQTMATVGYGKLVPVTFASNSIASIEALLGLLGFALVTGLMFAKFARPSAAVMFSDLMVFTGFEGQPCLQFRLANERASQIVEAQLRLVMMRSTITAEGHPVRRLHDLGLMRSHNAFFSLTWLALHPIDEKSPLYGMTFEELAASDVNFVVSLVGLEEISGQTVHARQWYTGADLRQDMRFVDIIGLDESGQPVIDYAKFHLVEPASAKLAQPLGTRGLAVQTAKAG